MGTNPPLTPGEVMPNTGAPDAETAPGVTAFAGIPHDDDGLALDQYFEAADSGPQEYMGVTPPVSELPSTNRIVRARYNFSNSTPQSVRALPPDPNRKHLIVTVWAVGPTFTALWSGEPFSVAVSGDNGVFANILPVSANLVPTTLILDDYTGPLYIGSLTDGQTIFFEITAVTS